jgi:hypothetical protein
MERKDQRFSTRVVEPPQRRSLQHVPGGCAHRRLIFQLRRLGRSQACGHFPKHGGMQAAILAQI